MVDGVQVFFELRVVPIDSYNMTSCSSVGQLNTTIAEYPNQHHKMRCGVRAQLIRRYLMFSDRLLSRMCTRGQRLSFPPYLRRQKAFSIA